MAATHAYLTHPQVKIDPAVPVPRWGLSEVGVARLRTLSGKPWIGAFRRIVASDEVKAIETAAIIAAMLGIPVEQRSGLHENDRSATGFLPPDRFEEVADQFFANPDASVLGWEKAIDAQSRIYAGVMQTLAEAPDVPTLFVGHGGVGTLLKCRIGNLPIARIQDQGPGGGGRYFHFTISPPALLHDWKTIEE